MCPGVAGVECARVLSLSVCCAACPAPETLLSLRGGACERKEKPCTGDMGRYGEIWGDAEAGGDRLLLASPQVALSQPYNHKAIFSSSSLPGRIDSLPPR